jgi:hypothetical protein
MSENRFDANQFLMMINILNVATKHLKEEVSDLKTQEIEQRWKELLSTLHSCFAYAQTYDIDLREYKTDLRDILDNLYGIEKLVRNRKDGKITVIDDIAQGVIFIASKIDDVLEGVGWKRVVRPITEAIFMIPKKIIAMFSKKTETPQMLPNIIQQYLPPPMKSLPNSKNAYQPTPAHKNNDVIDVEWVETSNTEESFAQKLLRQRRERIARTESGSE